MLPDDEEVVTPPPSPAATAPPAATTEESSADEAVNEGDLSDVIGAGDSSLIPGDETDEAASSSAIEPEHPAPAPPPSDASSAISSSHADIDSTIYDGNGITKALAGSSTITPWKGEDILGRGQSPGSDEMQAVEVSRQPPSS